MDRHARDLHERMMAVRMMPIKTLFTRFPRLVRDLTAAAGKQVELETAGEETELDKTVIEKIGDPLTHLIRNAVDHGIEPPEDRALRRQAGSRHGAARGLPPGRQHRHRGRRRRRRARPRRGSSPRRVENGLVEADDQTLSDEEVVRR